MHPTYKYVPTTFENGSLSILLDLHSSQALMPLHRRRLNNYLLLFFPVRFHVPFIHLSFSFDQIDSVGCRFGSFSPTKQNFPLIIYVFETINVKAKRRKSKTFVRWMETSIQWILSTFFIIIFIIQCNFVQSSSSDIRAKVDFSIDQCLILILDFIEWWFTQCPHRNDST